MLNYLVSYDLDKPGPQDYGRLDTELRKMGATQVLYSQWFLKTHLSTGELEQRFMGYIDPLTDSFLVVQIHQGQTAWNKLMVPDNVFLELVAAD
jgi:hypothetical protein